MKRPRQTREWWQGKIIQQKSSGLSGLAFCKEHGLCYNQFNTWKRRPAEGEGTGFSPVSITSPRASDALAGVRGVFHFPGGISLEAEGITADFLYRLGR